MENGSRLFRGVGAVLLGGSLVLATATAADAGGSSLVVSTDPVGVPGKDITVLVARDPDAPTPEPGSACIVALDGEAVGSCEVGVRFRRDAVTVTVPAREPGTATVTVTVTGTDSACSALCPTLTWSGSTTLTVAPTVPDVVAMDVAHAEAAATGVGMTLAGAEGFDPVASRVLTQSPGPGGPVGEGKPITVEVLALVRVPELTGLTADEATARVGDRLGLVRTGDLKGLSDTQDLEPGSLVDPGTAVTVHFAPPVITSTGSPDGGTRTASGGATGSGTTSSSSPPSSGPTTTTPPTPSADPTGVDAEHGAKDGAGGWEPVRTLVLIAVVLLVTSGLALARQRGRGQRWVGQHLTARPHLGTPRIPTVAGDPRPRVDIRIEPHDGPVRQHLEEAVR